MRRQRKQSFMIPFSTADLFVCLCVCVCVRLCVCACLCLVHLCLMHTHIYVNMHVSFFACIRSENWVIPMSFWHVQMCTSYCLCVCLCVRQSCVCMSCVQVDVHVRAAKALLAPESFSTMFIQPTYDILKSHKSDFR